ncbi:putative testican-2 [Penaeus vannamei]|uniref:Putative testican-2 n=1 Tax=Penaeus vannamei TaxID=6689 RepID=A0A3R7QM51_PENVA|nr:putative testican-2 [Penaeus vannamei]
MDKYNAHRQWSRRTNDPTRLASNTVWGPNECTQDALEAMGNRMLDWFSVIMADSRRRTNSVTKAPSWCKPEVSWMLGHLDGDSDGRLSVKELYQLEHDDHERCIKPFIDRCDLDRDIFLSAREWCKCFDKSERPCAALRKASKGLLGGYIPECDSEGYYQPTQCHAGAGVCWCVDRHGVELPSTRTHSTPNCDAIVNSQERGRLSFPLLLFLSLFLSLSCDRRPTKPPGALATSPHFFPSENHRISKAFVSFWGREKGLSLRPSLCVSLEIV